MSARVTIVQTCVPDYRLEFFRQLEGSVGQMVVLGGDSFFSSSVRSAAEGQPWHRRVRNHFFLGRQLLWQSGVISLAGKSELVVVEWNPRVLSTWCLLIRRFLSGRPTLVWGHVNSQLALSQTIRDFMASLSAGLIAYTHTQAAIAQTRHPALKVLAAPNSGVATVEVASDVGGAKPRNVIYVGRLTAQKKVMILIDAWALVAAEMRKDSKLVIVGDGPERANLEARVATLGLTACVEFRGHVSDIVELRKSYQTAAVAVSPGYVGLSAIQSMAFGVPMAVSRNEAHSPEIEACIEGVTCRFFDTDQPKSLAEMLTDFLSETGGWQGRRKEIAEFIRHYYTIEGMVLGFSRALAQVAPASAPVVAVVWSQFGPYHLARLKGFRDVAGADRVCGIEIANKTVTYEWKSSGADRPVITLWPEKAAEDVSAVQVYRRAYTVFCRERVRVVLVPSYWPASSLAIMLAAKNAGARIVMMNESHEHTSKAKGIWAKVKTKLVLQFDAALLAGKPHKKYFVSMGMDERKIVLGYDAVDNDYFVRRSAEVRANAAQVRARHGLPERYFLNIGRMVWKKNLTVFIEAYAQVRELMGEACPRLVLVGSGALEASLQTQCLGRGLSIWRASAAPSARKGDADVFFYGFRQIDELPDFYALAECFVLPSSEEEWGLVVNESMASGLPVLVSEVVGCAPDLVEHGVNGYQFPPADAKALAQCLHAIALDPAKAKQMGRESQRIVSAWGCDRFGRGAMEAAEIALNFSS